MPKNSSKSIKTSTICPKNFSNLHCYLSSSLFQTNQLSSEMSTQTNNLSHTAFLYVPTLGTPSVYIPHHPITQILAIKDFFRASMRCIDLAAYVGEHDRASLIPKYLALLGLLLGGKDLLKSNRPALYRVQHVSANYGNSVGAMANGVVATLIDLDIKQYLPSSVFDPPTGIPPPSTTTANPLSVPVTVPTMESTASTNDTRPQIHPTLTAETDEHGREELVVRYPVEIYQEDCENPHCTVPEGSLLHIPTTRLFVRNDDATSEEDSEITYNVCRKCAREHKNWITKRKVLRYQS